MIYKEIVFFHHNVGGRSLQCISYVQICFLLWLNIFLVSAFTPSCLLVQRCQRNSNKQCWVNFGLSFTVIFTRSSDLWLIDLHSRLHISMMKMLWYQNHVLISDQWVMDLCSELDTPKMQVLWFRNYMF